MLVTISEAYRRVSMHGVREALPDGVDPCGENGEFHTFVWDGPMFNHPVKVEVGETVEREGFVFTDLLPA